MKRDYWNLLPVFFASLVLILPQAAMSQTQQQKPPVQQQEETEEYTEEEWDAYDKAVNEADLDKRLTLLTEFMDKYPKSKLQPYIVTAYQTIMYELQKDQKYAKLEPVAEKWLKYFPGEMQTIAYVAESAQKLGHHQKFIDYGLKIYSHKPTGSVAYLISQSYKELGNEAKFLEWTEKLFEYPEFNDEFGLRMEFVTRYAAENQLEKAAKYAQLALQSLDQAKKPEGKSDSEWRNTVNTVRRVCSQVVAMNHYDKDRYGDAIRSFREALKYEKTDVGYYYIGLSQWKLDQVEDAMLSFAKAELLKGEVRNQAKEHLEKIYKALHNNTTVGIHKIYRRAEQELAADRAPGD